MTGESVTLFLGNTMPAWTTAVGVTLLALVVLWTARALVLHRARTLAGRPGRTQRSAQIVAAVLGGARFWVACVFALYLGSVALFLPLWIGRWTGAIATIALLIQVAIWGDALIGFWLRSLEPGRPGGNGERANTLAASVFLMRLALFSIVGLVAINNIPGIQVSALITSLGIGGLAVALAVQNILADLFASLSIALDRPFIVGDVISVDTYEGTVEKIGMKTTRLRSLTGEELIFANNDLLRSRVRNFRHMAERRAVFAVGLPIETPRERMAAVPATLREVVEAQPGVRFERAHLRDISGPCVTFEVVYHVLSPSYDCYMDVQQAINLELIARFPDGQLRVKAGPGAAPC